MSKLVVTQELYICPGATECRHHHEASCGHGTPHIWRDDCSKKCKNEDGVESNSICECLLGDWDK